MNETKQFIGGVYWTIGRPGTEQRITMKFDGRDWPVDAVKAESSKGTFWLFDYQVFEWNPRGRPFDRNWHLGLDSSGKVIVRAPDQERVLWSLATGKDWGELPETTASMVSEAPASRRHPPQQAQQHRVEPGMTQEVPRQNMRTRVAKILRFIGDHDTGTHDERQGH